MWYAELCQRGDGIAGEKVEQKIISNPRSRAHTTGPHNSNEAIYPPTYSSTAERSTTVTPTKRSTHPACITAVQQMTYSRGRGRERAVKAPRGQKTKVRNTSNTLSHEHTRPSTHTPTRRPNNPPTHQPTLPRCATAIQQSTAADALMMTQTELQ